MRGFDTMSASRKKKLPNEENAANMTEKQREGNPGDRIGDLRTSLGMTKKELSRKNGIDAS